MTITNNSSMADVSITNSTANIISQSSDSESGRCSGFLSFFHNIKLFTCIMCIVSLINGSVSASYLPAVISTMEKRFHIGSYISGIIVGSHEIGACISVVLVSYFGHHGHIPLILGWGTLLIGLGSAVFSLPHFISPIYSSELEQNKFGSNETKFCSAAVESATGTPAPEHCEGTTAEGATLYVAIFIIAQTLIGIGSSPLMTIGLSYVDNFVSKKTSAQYIALIYAAAILGSVLGFGVGAGMLEVYIDVFTHGPHFLGLTSKDRRWLGAWWAGFLLFGILLLLNAPWLCMFPKSISTSDSTDSAASSGSSDEPDVKPSAGLAGNKLSDLPRSVLHLLKNPVYMLLNLGSVCEMMVVCGFLTFAAKYLETQFYVKQSSASLIAGGVAVPAAVLGILSMGFIIKRYNIGPLGAGKLVVFWNIVGICGLLVAFVLRCDNLQIAGITTDYINNQTANFQINLAEGCNQNCNCNDNMYDPVCHRGRHMTYFSKCHAGCQQLRASQIEECSCIEPDYVPDNPSAEGVFKEGMCDSTCLLMPVYLVMLAVVSFSIAAIRTPVALITLRCVDDNLKSFGLGIQVMIIRLLAMLPAPIIYGLIIDSSCLWWQTECEKDLNCLIYDNREFNIRFQGISLGFHLLGSVMFFVSWLILRRGYLKDDDESHGTPKVPENESDGDLTVTRL